jgi:ribonuclease R
MSVQGKISVHPRGFGFFTAEDGRVGFVTPPDLNAFLDGDEVTAQLDSTEPERWSASQLKLVRRQREQLFGQVYFRGKRPFLKIDRLIANTDWPLLEQPQLKLVEGLTLVAQVEGQQLRPLRKVDEQGDVGLERCLVRHQIRAQFPEPLSQVQGQPIALGHRRDLRSLPTVTIDAPSTTDIDDALSCLAAEPDGSLRVLVSIADVDSQVPAGSALDHEARLRGTSVYLAGRVIPMLPDGLSSDALSLLPGVDRLALTAELRLDCEGQLTSVDLYESLIRSDMRLSYEEVSEFLAGQHDQLPSEIGDTLRRLRAAAARLSTVRAARGGVEVASEEAYVSFDPATRQPTGLEPRAETPAHRLVERLMVAANEAVAGWLVARGLPGMYRIHPEPQSEQLQKLAQSASNFGIEAAFGPRLSPRGLAAFEAQYRGTPLANAMRTVVGGILGPARYTVEPGLHFGLGAPLYLHFTSPIRRYADLVVHRIVKGYLSGERGQHPQDPHLAQLAEQLNHLAWKASKAENERFRMVVARLFRDRVGQELLGYVVAIKHFGLIVQLQGTGASGTLPPDSSLAIGDSVTCRIASVQEELGRIELERL